MDNRIRQNIKRIVVKIGSSTLTHENGNLNLHRIEILARTLSDIKNSGIEVVLVSSGAVAAGIARTHLKRRPESVEEKMALAAVGQSELMRIYERFFSSYGHTVGQILMTKDVIDNPVRREAAEGTFLRLLEMGIIPIVNENDSVSYEEIKFGGNDTLSAYVCMVCHAELLINMTDIDGYYESDPRKNPDAKLIERVEHIDESVYAAAGGAGSDRGTGGMYSKIKAADLVTSVGIPMMIVKGTDPTVLYSVLEGDARGTFFAADKTKRAK